MSVDVDHSEDDSDLLDDLEADGDDQPKLSAKEVNQHMLDMRRKIEDRLERRRLRDMLGCDDLELGF